METSPKKNETLPNPPNAGSVSASKIPWYRQLNWYHWFVLILCTMGWTFDCLDQQLFALSRSPAIAELLRISERDPHVSTYAGYATSLMLIGWATGGIIFGICGDKYGRVRTMFWTILMYAGFTGLTGFARNVPEFLVLRFLTGLGVGGQFAVCATIVAESMPSEARAYALGFLQAISAFGNIAAAFITLGIGELIELDLLPGNWSTWRWSFVVGILPVFLVIFVRYMDEPEAWKKAKAEEKRGGRKSGSIVELFTDPQIRKRVILGMMLAMVGVIGFWGIMLFAIDLNRSVFRKSSELAHQSKNILIEKEFLAQMLVDPKFADQVFEEKISSDYFMSLPVDPASPSINGSAIFKSFQKNHLEMKPLALDNKEWSHWLSGVETKGDSASLIPKLTEQKKEYDLIVGRWGSLTSVLINIGGFFGIFSFTLITNRIGRRPTFTIFLLSSMITTLAVFLLMDCLWKVLVFVPLMGFSLVSLMGGFTIYFPELFPTRLRSTSVSFCYNVGRYVAAIGPGLFGGLTAYIFTEANGFSEPIRYAGASLCPIFLLGILIIWFLPETKGKPLPE